jgi:ATP-dependent DNA ligase
MGLEGIVSKRLGSAYRWGRCRDWLKFKNPDARAVRREAEEEWGRKKGGWGTLRLAGRGGARQVDCCRRQRNRKGARSATGAAPWTRLPAACTYLRDTMLSRAAPSGFIEPCLPSSAERPPSDPNWIHEIKHDGYRFDGAPRLDRHRHSAVDAQRQ